MASFLNAGYFEQIAGIKGHYAGLMPEGIHQFGQKVLLAGF